MADKPDWFLLLTPVGKVPVIKHGDFVGIESAVLNNYLDEKYPETKLLPESPEQKVLDANLVDEFGRKVSSWSNNISNSNNDSKSHSSSSNNNNSKSNTN